MTVAHRLPRTNTWVATQRRDDEARIRLFCLPHAGAGTAMFNLWRRILPGFIEVCPILLPGREGRLSEDSFTDSDTLIEQVTAGIADYIDRPYAIFGHSMGSLLAFELAHSLRAHGLREPSHLFLSGRNAPHLYLGQTRLHQLPDDRFLAELDARYGGLPQEVLADPELLELYLPILRADLTLLETHLHRDRHPLVCPISAFAGKQDKNVSVTGLEAWGEHTAGAFEAEWLDGGHFYLTGISKASLLERIASRLAGIDSATARPSEIGSGRDAR